MLTSEFQVELLKSSEFTELIEGALLKALEGTLSETLPKPCEAELLLPLLELLELELVVMFDCQFIADTGTTYRLPLKLVEPPRIA